VSCVLCSRCNRLIDSDEDCDCFVNAGDLIVCEWCRSDMEQAGELDVETNTTREPSADVDTAKVPLIRLTERQAC
jgi:hypothetical protein